MRARLVLAEFFGGFVTLPGWWYTRGLARVLGWARRSVREASELFALGVWVRNLFVPMYGDTQWSGRIISFFVRLFMIAARGTAVGGWAAASGVAVAAYVAVLPAAVIGLLYHGLGRLLA